MLRSETLFGKRETTTPNTPFGGANVTPPSAASGPRVVQPASGAAASSPSSSSSSNSSTNEVGSKLIVGPNIQLEGKITNCDTLMVEGLVQATIVSRVIQIAENGKFEGSAEVELAEIRGNFSGKLVVRQKLVVYATGTVTGEIRYGKLVIEEGGQVSGDVQVNGHHQPELGEMISDKTHKTALA
jgi:cytoskeletal protein CcmA (bactofilin family)